MRHLILTLILLLSPISISADDETVKDQRYYNQIAMEAYQLGDFQKFRDIFIEAVKHYPENPAMHYNMACGYALTGNAEKALEVLDKLADKGIDYGAQQDGDFSLLHNDERFKVIVAKLEKYHKKISNSETAFRVAEKDLIPEGIAYDPVEDKFYLSSVYKRKIIAVDRDGGAKDFITDKQNGIWGVLGMKVDPQRRILWVCSSASNLMKGFTPEDSGTGIFKYDLETGRLIKKYLGPDDNPSCEFNDLVVNSFGDVFATDSYHGAVYKIDHNKNKLEVLIPPHNLYASNGIALSSDEKTLFVAAYGEGIYAVNPETGEYKMLKHPENISPYSIDGICFYKNSLIVIQNSIVPHRVVRFYLNKNMDGIMEAEIIEMNNEYFQEPTTGAIAGDEFYYIANSQLGSYDNEGNLWPMDKLNEVVILKTKLE
jgi:sugar lactone lactonase YvrE